MNEVHGGGRVEAGNGSCPSRKIQALAARRNPDAAPPPANGGGASSPQAPARLQPSSAADGIYGAGGASARIGDGS